MEPVAISLIHSNNNQVEINNMENIKHEALIGVKLTLKEATKSPTIVTLGDTPFNNDREELEHHAIVATKIVSDPVGPHHPDLIQ
eukprot:9879766-Ditylum_brightwellii.AAC.1